MRKRLTGPLLAAAFLLVAVAASAAEPDSTTVAPAPADTAAVAAPVDTAAVAAPELIDRILVIVDEEAILQSDLQREVSLYYLEARNAGQQIDRSRSEVRDEVLDRLIESKLIIAAARQAEISIEDEAIAGGVEDNINQLIRYYGSRTKLEAELERNGMSLNDYRTRAASQLRDQQYMRAVINRFIRPQVDVREDEVATYYREHEAELPATPDSLTLANILIPVQPAEDVRTVIQGMLGATLQDLAAGMDFAEAARKHSAGPNAQRGGKIGVVKQGDLFSKDLDRAVFALQPGETSQPVVTERGVHLVHLDSTGEAGREISQIFFPLELTEADVERARERAVSAHQRILQGEPFARVAIEMSADPSSAEKGGDLGTFALDSLAPQIQEQLQESKAGDLTEPFLSPAGFYIFLVKDRVNGSRLGYEEVKERLKRMVESVKMEAKLTAYIEELRDRFVVDIK